MLLSFFGGCFNTWVYLSILNRSLQGCSAGSSEPCDCFQDVQPSSVVLSCTMHFGNMTMRDFEAKKLEHVITKRAGKLRIESVAGDLALLASSVRDIQHTLEWFCSQVWSPRDENQHHQFGRRGSIPENSGIFLAGGFFRSVAGLSLRDRLRSLDRQRDSGRQPLLFFCRKEPVEVWEGD